MPDTKKIKNTKIAFIMLSIMAVAGSFIYNKNFCAGQASSSFWNGTRNKRN